MPDGWPENFRDNEYVTFDPPLTEEAAAWWNRRFDTAVTGLFPEAFIDAIARDAPGAITGRIVSLDHVAETFKVEVTGLAPGPTEIFYKAKTFELTDGTARDGLTRVGPDWQGQGIGTGLMINLIDLGGAIGLDRIVVDAQDIGRYAWIPMGFLPDDTAWVKIIVPRAMEKLRLLRLLGQIDQPTFDEVKTILVQTDPRAIRDFLALDQTLPGAGPQGTAREVPLLSVLMLQPGTDWIGSFLFRDPITEKLFDSYKETHDVDHPRPWR